MRWPPHNEDLHWYWFKHKEHMMSDQPTPNTGKCEVCVAEMKSHANVELRTLRGVKLCAKHFLDYIARGVSDERERHWWEGTNPFSPLYAEARNPFRVSIVPL